jgi:hypothetical protein
MLLPQSLLAQPTARIPTGSQNQLALGTLWMEATRIQPASMMQLAGSFPPTCAVAAKWAQAEAETDREVWRGVPQGALDFGNWRRLAAAARGYLSLLIYLRSKSPRTFRVSGACPTF